jgi:LacI family transcriptional regulator
MAKRIQSRPLAKRTTIKDVAKEARISYQTVSRVINNKGEVSPEVSARVQVAIKKLGYRPNAIARSMVKGRTHMLGCIAPSLIDYTFACLVEGAKAEARLRGYYLLSSSAEQESEVPALCDELLHSGRVDGLLVINPYADARYRFIESLVAQGAIVVYAGVSARHGVVSSVGLDDEGGGYQAGRHLVTLGHTSIAMLTGPKNEDCVQDRNTGFLRALREAGLKVPAPLIVTGDWSASGGYQTMQQWLAAGETFTALFAQNDRMAVGAVKAARDFGKRIPQDLAVIGFDDIPLASYFDPPLSTIRQDIFEHGRQATRLLIEKTVKPSGPLERVVIPTQLVVRESSGGERRSNTH